ncbi:unnamed protein product [Cyprideis torosa]|uniref:Uncharacterized protein n=1 Tax=Cyprideis torosa TaxID=163714 RepID=A0A7R8W4D7_9CRUS|nr:unnamed protein product [Cyprideis torosa]CAG0884070.1 unnamed protein product [Cyprideis torosa]
MASSNEGPVLELVNILEKTVSPDNAERVTSQTFLEQAANQSLAEFLKSLSDVLWNAHFSPLARTAAGLQIKNQLTAKEPQLKLAYQQRWLELPQDIRAYIKNNVLGALGTETMRPSSAAQCVAYIAVAELPNGQWEDLIAQLCHNITNAQSTEMMREATLEAIGYICQDIEPEVVESRSNEILTAIVHGMKRGEQSDSVRLAATNALLNSLEFTKKNFDNTAERNYIMEVVCEATQSPNTQIKVVALQCLVRIMTLYYQYMETYMARALFAITLEAMQSDADEVALQGIEFWSSVCDEEIDLAVEASDAMELRKAPEHVSRFYAKGALQYLVPVLMNKLTRQEEQEDDDDWNPCKAAGVCLMLLATCCEDAVIEHVLPFVQQHITSPDWRYREASVMAFGSILEGPNTDTLVPIVIQAMPLLIELLKDSSVAVRDTTAWTVGKVCEIVPGAVLQDNFLKPLLGALVEGLQAEPRVAANICWAFTSLAEGANELAETPEGHDEPPTDKLSEYFDVIVGKLLETTDRPDGNHHRLRNAAYEAIMEMIKNAPTDCYATVQRTTMIILERLNQVLAMEGHIVNPNDRNQFHDLQSLLCATLQSVLRKMTKEDAPQISDAIMGALLHMFQSSSQSKQGGVQEDALIAVTTLVEALGEAFIKYMESLKPFLLIGLRNYHEVQVCQAAIGLTGDICRALGKHVLSFCDDVMALLLEIVSARDADRALKPQILGVFGDMALAIGLDFSKYLDYVLQVIQEASQAQATGNDYDVIDYMNELREGCLVAYSGIIQGFKEENGVVSPGLQKLQEHLQIVGNFIKLIIADPNKNDAVVASLAGLIGDLCGAFGLAVLPMAEDQVIYEFISAGRQSKHKKRKDYCTYALRELKKLRNEGRNAAAASR